jgi:hypothetical protein
MAGTTTWITGSRSTPETPAATISGPERVGEATVIEALSFHVAGSFGTAIRILESGEHATHGSSSHDSLSEQVDRLADALALVDQLGGDRVAGLALNTEGSPVRQRDRIDRKPALFRAKS